MSDGKRRGRHHAHIPHDERRGSPRRPASMVPNLKARLLAGPDVRLVDISRRGLLLETDSRLMPGSAIRIKLVADDANVVMKGCVIRSSVAVVTGEGIVYRTAISFDEDIALCDATLWEKDVEPQQETGEDAETEVEAAAEVPVASGGEPAAAPEGATAPPPAAPTTVTALFAASSEDLRALLAANDW